jgi:hypothetical protein
MTFDPQSFLDSSMAGSNDTKVIPVPVGEYMGIIEKVLPRQWQSRDGAQSGVAIDIFWLVEDANVKQYLGRATVTCKQGIMLDLTATGGVDMSKGKNIGLGRLREAIGRNDESPFSFSMLLGMSAKISVSHRINGEDTFAEVKGVAKL